MERSRRHFITKTLPALAFGPLIACSSANTPESAVKTSTGTVLDRTPTPEVAETPKHTHNPPTTEPTHIPTPSGPVRAATAQPTIVSERTPNTSNGEFSRGNLERAEIALTFDCGASGEPTPAILEALRSEGVKVTFFITGKWAQIYPELTRQIAYEHEIANHSFSHSDFSTLSNAQIIDETQKTEQVIMDITGKSTKPFWRAPFGSRNPRIMAAAAEAGWPNHIFWTVEQTNQGYITGDSGDWQDITPQQVKQNILSAANLGNGVITVSHCGSPLTPLVLKDTLRELKEKGLKVTTVSNILKP